MAMETPASKTFPRGFHALILAAGRGERLGSHTPKQYLDLGGLPVLRRTLDVFLACPGLSSLRVVIRPEDRALYEDAVRGLTLPEPVHGGSSRSESVYKGLRSFLDLEDEDLILTHDAARPFVREGEILSLVRALADGPAVTLAAPVADTLRRAKEGLASEVIDRTGTFAIQTPQGFHYGAIRRAHEEAAGREATDDTALVSALGLPVKLVAGSRRNFKITTQEDMELAREIMGAFETRIGMGFDVHAFTQGDGVRLGGVDIPFHKRLAGHSDADAALHALTDALLGTIGDGDIGAHFPPSDPRWRGADSALFLREAASRVTAQGGRIVNADLTIICEAPKIGPHRAAMQARISGILNVPLQRIGIKATTTESLGFTGRGEGIAVQAVVSCAFQMNR